VSYVGGLGFPPVIQRRRIQQRRQVDQRQHQVFPRILAILLTASPSREGSSSHRPGGADVSLHHILNLSLRGMEQAAKEKVPTSSRYTDRCGAECSLCPTHHRLRLSRLQYAIGKGREGDFTWKASCKRPTEDGTREPPA
jgi:hypothetical protein